MLLNSQNQSAASVRDCGKEADMNNFKFNNSNQKVLVGGKIAILYQRLSV
jgi:hypothetical protein